MIAFTKAFVTGDGQTHASLEEAQKHELKGIFSSAAMTDVDNAVAAVINHKEAIVDILTTKPNSKPKARSINGGTKRRGSRSATPAPTPGAPSPN